MKPVFWLFFLFIALCFVPQQSLAVLEYPSHGSTSVVKPDSTIAPTHTTTIEEDNASINRYQTAIKSLEKWRWICASVILVIVLMGISLNSGQIFQALIPASMWWVVNSYIRNLEGKIYDIEHPYVEGDETPGSGESRNNNLPADPVAITSFALSLGFIASILLVASAISDALSILILLTLIPAIVTAISALTRTKNEQFRKRYSVQKSRRLARAALLITLLPVALILALLLILFASFF